MIENLASPCGLVAANQAGYLTEAGRRHAGAMPSRTAKRTCKRAMITARLPASAGPTLGKASDGVAELPERE